MATKRREEPVRLATAVLDTRAAADFLGVSARTLENFRVRGGGPRFVKIGGAVRYRVESLEAFLRQRERASTSDPGQGAA
jgi:predicted DNA-binding transcriptional regulator AlpA